MADLEESGVVDLLLEGDLDFDDIFLWLVALLFWPDLPIYFLDEGFLSSDEVFAGLTSFFIGGLEDF